MKEVTYGAIADSKASFNNSGIKVCTDNKGTEHRSFKEWIHYLSFRIMERQRKRTGILFELQAVKDALRDAELRKEDILKENELEKFQKDFIQQIHNGTVQKEKEIDLV